MKRYSTKEAIEIKSLIELGVPKAKVARKYGISRQAVYQWLDRLQNQNNIAS